MPISIQTMRLVMANYPENILVTAAVNIPGKKWAAYCCLQEGGVTQKVLFQTPYKYVTELEAKANMHIVVSRCLEYCIDNPQGDEC